MPKGTTAEELRAEAAQHEANAEESFERCDTDGFLSQWASGVNAQLCRLQASIQEAGGVAEFPALFDAWTGERVKARLVWCENRFAPGGAKRPVWVVLDEAGEAIQWVSAFPKREATIRRKGFVEGTEEAPAKARLSEGSGGFCGVRPVTYRTDKGYPEGAVIWSPVE